MMYEEIRQHGKLYLRRWRILSTKWFGIYLHCFHAPDDDRDLHNHPWSWAASLILAGWYIESVGVPGPSKVCRLTSRYYEVRSTLRRKEKIWYTGSFRFFRGSTYHAVSDIKAPGKVWTLFIHGPMVREWGFFDSDTGKHISWKAYMWKHGLMTKEQIQEKALVGAEYK